MHATPNLTCTPCLHDSVLKKRRKQIHDFIEISSDISTPIDQQDKSTFGVRQCAVRRHKSPKPCTHKAWNHDEELVSSCLSTVEYLDLASVSRIERAPAHLHRMSNSPCRDKPAKHATIVDLFLPQIYETTNKLCFTGQTSQQHDGTISANRSRADRQICKSHQIDIPPASELQRGDNYEPFSGAIRTFNPIESAHDVGAEIVHQTRQRAENKTTMQRDSTRMIGEGQEQARVDDEQRHENSSENERQSNRPKRSPTADAKLRKDKRGKIPSRTRLVSDNSDQGVRGIPPPPPPPPPPAGLRLKQAGNCSQQPSRPSTYKMSGDEVSLTRDGIARVMTKLDAIYGLMTRTLFAVEQRAASSCATEPISSVGHVTEADAAVRNSSLAPVDARSQHIADCREAMLAELRERIESRKNLCDEASNEQ